MKEALGIIETRGKTALITAVDAALKAAGVSLLGCRLVGGGLVNATVTGDVGSVKAAMDAACAAIRMLSAGGQASGQTWVIPRPAGDVWAMLEEGKSEEAVTPPPPIAPIKEPKAPPRKKPRKTGGKK